MQAGARPFRLLHNSLFAGLTGASNFLFLLLFLVTARYLGPESLGTLALGMAVGTAVAFGLNFGINSVAIRRIATEPQLAAAVAVQLLLCRLAISIVGVAILVPAVSAVMPEGTQRSVVLLFAISGVLRSINMSSRALLQASDRFAWESAVVFVDAVAILLLGMIALHLGGGEIALAQVFVAVRAVIAAGYLFITPRLFQGLHWRFERPLSWSLLATGFPLGIATALITLFWQMDILMLSAWSTALATGVFSAAWSIVDGLRMAPDTQGAAFYPRLAAKAAADLPEFDAEFARGCRYLLVLGTACAVLLAVFGPQIIRLLYGNGFMAAGEVIVGLAALPVMLFLGTFAFVGLRALGRESQVMHVMVLAVGSKLLLGMMLVPAYGIDGAAIAALGSAVILMVAVLVAVWHARASLLGLPRLIVSLAAIGGVAVATGWLLLPHSLIAAVFAVPLLFALGLVPLRVVERAELAWLRRMLRTRSRGRGD